MSWKDKLVGSRILAIGRQRCKKNDGTTITVTKDIRCTVKDGSSTIHMYDLDDVKHYCKHSDCCKFRDGRGDQISTPNSRETGVGSRTKNREIKKGYSPINQIIKINQAIRRNL